MSNLTSPHNNPLSTLSDWYRCSECSATEVRLHYRWIKSSKSLRRMPLLCSVCVAALGPAHELVSNYTPAVVADNTLVIPPTYPAMNEADLLLLKIQRPGAFTEWHELPIVRYLMTPQIWDSLYIVSDCSGAM